MPAIGLALDFLWEFLKPILSDSLKERLKQEKHRYGCS